jgi:hypothetical protein
MGPCHHHHSRSSTNEAWESCWDTTLYVFLSFPRRCNVPLPFWLSSHKSTLVFEVFRANMAQAASQTERYQCMCYFTNQFFARLVTVFLLELHGKYHRHSWSKEVGWEETISSHRCQWSTILYNSYLATRTIHSCNMMAGDMAYPTATHMVYTHNTHQTRKPFYITPYRQKDLSSRENYASELHQVVILHLSKVDRTSWDQMASHGHRLGQSSADFAPSKVKLWPEFKLNSLYIKWHIYRRLEQGFFDVISHYRRRRGESKKRKIVCGSAWNVHVYTLHRCIHKSPSLDTLIILINL